MPKTGPHHYTHSHVILNDGALSFKCSQDVSVWPWLVLPPHDPIVVQTINYWAPVEIGETRGTFDRTKWTALTETEWVCQDPGTGHAVRGIAQPLDEHGSMFYDVKFFDEQDALVYILSGKGVVFQNRDFEAWRTKAKEKMAALPKITDFQKAPSRLVGIEDKAPCFISTLNIGDSISAQGFITKDEGFFPAHPYISGSGDHVNSTQLADVSLQFVSLLNSGCQLYCTGGKMEFLKFVELDYHFDIKLNDHDQGDKAVTLSVYQMEKLCAVITIKYDFA